MIKKSILVTVLALGLMAGVFSTPVQADGTETKTETTCTTDAYGQESCVTTTKEESSRVVYKDEEQIADTALDTQTLMVLMAVLSVGAAAAFFKFKLAR